MMTSPVSGALDEASYLERIGVASELSGGPSVAQLTLLHQQHLLTVPFENLDVHRGVEVRLDQERILAKIVASRRGGFCYELNAAFAWLLRRLGYRVELLSAQVKNSDGQYGIPFDHMLLRVQLPEGDYLADVGFGDSFQNPLPLRLEVESAEPAPPRAPLCRYRLRELRGHHHLERAVNANGEGFAVRYRFTLTPHRLRDYEAGCRYHQTSAQSPFTKQKLVTRALPNGRVTLLSDRLIRTLDGDRNEIPLADSGAWHQALEEHFGVILDRNPH